MVRILVIVTTPIILANDLGKFNRFSAGSMSPPSRLPSARCRPTKSTSAKPSCDSRVSLFSRTKATRGFE